VLEEDKPKENKCSILFECDVNDEDCEYEVGSVINGLGYCKYYNVEDSYCDCYSANVNRLVRALKVLTGKDVKLT
jgi:hypothetical protein